MGRRSLQTTREETWRVSARRMILAVLALLAGCAGAEGQTKGGGLEPFAEAGVTEEATRGDRYALVVGIDQFEDEKFGDLKYAARDAEAMADALSGFDEVIRHTDPDETDRADILEGIERLGELADSPRDVVFVYFSTHGTLARSPGGELERYLVARDTKLDLAASTGLGVEQVLSRIEEFASERTAMVLASCHSGSGKSAISDELAEALAQRKSSGVPPLRKVSEATIVLSASAFEEAAREEPSFEHDIYTYFFLEGLEEGDRDGDGAVTASEAHDYARRRTYAFTDGAQRPTAWSSVLGRDPIVLAGQPDGEGKPVLYSYQRSARGLEMAVDGNTKGKLPGGLAVEPGRHRIELTNAESGETVWEGRVNVADGERLEVSELIPPASSVELRVEGGGWGPLGTSTRQSYLPAAWSIGAAAALLREPWRHSVLEVRGAMFGAGASTSAFGTDVPYRLRAGHVQLGAGAILELGAGFEVRTGGQAGVLWARRRFETSSYEHTERMRGTTVGAFGDVAWQRLGRLRMMLRTELGLLRAPLGEQVGLHPYGALNLGVGVGF